MMKRVLIILFVVIFCVKSFCQDSKISLGVEFTPTISWLGEISGTKDKRMGYSFGIISEYSVNSQVSFKTGLSYERKGSGAALLVADTTGLPLGSFDVYFKYDYLILPVLGTFCTKGKIKVYFNAGTYLGYLLSQKNIYEAYNNTPEKIIDNSDKTKRIDFGLSFGSGVSIPFGTHSIFELGIKPNLGFINTRKDDNNNYNGLKINSFGFSIGFKYKL